MPDKAIETAGWIAGLAVKPRNKSAIGILCNNQHRYKVYQQTNIPRSSNTSKRQSTVLLHSSPIAALLLRFRIQIPKAVRE